MKFSVWAFIGIILLTLPGSAQSYAATQAQQADSFVDSVGMNTHMKYQGKPYWNKWPQVRDKLYDSKIRHVRDAAYRTRTTDPNNAISVYYSRMQELAANGVKTNYLFTAGGDGVSDPSTVEAGETDFDYVARRAGSSYESAEGTNEYDAGGVCTTYGPRIRELQGKLFNLSRANPATATKPVIGPSLIRNAYGPPCVGDLSGSMDAGGMHHYYSGFHPGTPGFGATATCSQGLAYGNLDYGRNCYAVMSGTKPIWSTETGYHTASGNTYGVTEATQAKYVPRMFLDHFRRGVPRTYFYELADQGTDPTRAEGMYGLLRYDVSEKPAFSALKNLLTLLEDPGASFTPGSLDYSLSGDTADVNQLLLQKRDGKFYLVLWQEVSSMAPNTYTDANVADKAVTVNFTNASAVTSYLPKDGAASTGQSSGEVSSYNASVPDHPLVLEITPGTVPSVLTTDPADGATGVGIDSNITATFSEPIKESYIESAYKVRLYDTVSKAITYPTVTYDAATKTATIDPQASLVANRRYQVTVYATGVYDLDGNRMASNRVWYFTTAS